MLATVLAAIAIASPAPQEGIVRSYSPSGPVIVVTVDRRGSFEITTDPETSPLTVKHILGLTRRGFYNGQRVHRVESWVTQWGAPASGRIAYNKWWTWKRDKSGKRVAEMKEAVGGGGSGKDIPKFEEAPDVDFVRGIVGIASTGLQVPGDSQLFILKADALRLYRSYAVVGKVTKGMSVVDKIKRGDRISSMRVKGEAMMRRRRR
jgi:cyclophilin family peptidyl-prolyl cis-trans isomerase